MRKHSDLPRECTLGRVPASMASISGTNLPEIRTLFKNLCYRDFTITEKGTDPQSRITRHYSSVHFTGILQVPRLGLTNISPAIILMVTKTGTTTKFRGKLHL